MSVLAHKAAGTVRIISIIILGVCVNSLRLADIINEQIDQLQR